MSDHGILELFSIFGLGLSIVSVCDMLGRWDVAALRYLYLIYAAIVVFSIFAIVLSRKINANFLQICKQRPALISIRLVLAALLALLGWYINAAMKASGADAAMTAYNGVRMFSVIFCLIWHVFYAAFSKKAGNV